MGVRASSGLLRLIDVWDSAEHAERYSAEIYLLLPVVNVKQRDAFVAEGWNWTAWASSGAPSPADRSPPSSWPG